MQDINDAMIEHENLVYFVINKHFRNLINNEDALQEGRIGLWKALMNYDEIKSAFSTYACKCIYNQILQYFRAANAKKRRELKTVSFDEIINDTEGLTYKDVLTASDNVEGELIKRSEVQAVFKIINNQIKPLHKKALIMELQGYKQAHIAKSVNISRPSISRMNQKTRTKLKALIS